MCFSVCERAKLEFSVRLLATQGRVASFESASKQTTFCVANGVPSATPRIQAKAQSI